MCSHWLTSPVTGITDSCRSYSFPGTFAHLILAEVRFGYIGLYSYARSIWKCRTYILVKLVIKLERIKSVSRRLSGLVSFGLVLLQ